mmetsp:Transcript_62695/g.148489  ORF Transcript_62695/g.148489 Transcript_62695/m.148489 type:complete len:189 (-) Transcript_62695:23-589(-)
MGLLSFLSTKEYDAQKYCQLDEIGDAKCSPSKKGLDSRSPKKKPFAGVGLILQLVDGKIVICNMAKDGSAYRSGQFSIGDEIVNVNSQKVTGVKEAAALITGPANTPVKITFRRAKDGLAFRTSLMRRTMISRLTIQSVAASKKAVGSPKATIAKNGSPKVECASVDVREACSPRRVFKVASQRKEFN